MNGNFLYVLSAGACAGIASALLLPIGLGIILGLLFFAMVGMAIAFRVRDARFVAFGLLCAAAALGMIRTNLFLEKQAGETLPQYIDRTNVIDGTIASDPERTDFSMRAAIAVTHINGEEGGGWVLAELPRDADVSYGDNVRMRGLLEAPQPFETNGGRQFDYPDYLRAQGVGAIMRHASLQADEPGGATLQGWLYALKHVFEDSLERLSPEPQAGLLEGILLGEKRGISQDLTQAFIASGLVHVVVLSGYNITVVSEAVLRALAFLPAPFKFSAGGIVMILFALMSGAGAATVRAVIMALVAILGRYLGRPSAALRALALAAVLMALWNPPALLYDTGFILSILATFGLITISPSVERVLLRLPLFASGALASLRSIAASTIAVQIFALPALLYFTGVLSVLSLPANVLALPVVPAAMFLGFTAGMLGLVHPLLAFIPAALADALLRWMIFVAHGIAQIPLGAFITPAFPAWLMFVAYVPLSLLAVHLYRKEPA